MILDISKDVTSLEYHWTGSQVLAGEAIQLLKRTKNRTHLSHRGLHYWWIITDPVESQKDVHPITLLIVRRNTYHCLKFGSRILLPIVFHFNVFHKRNEQQCDSS